MCISTNIVKIRSFFALALSRSSDPELSYLFWTISMYIFLQRSLVKGNYAPTISPKYISCGIAQFIVQ